LSLLLLSLLQLLTLLLLSLLLLEGLLLNLHVNGGSLLGSNDQNTISCQVRGHILWLGALGKAVPATKIKNHQVFPVNIKLNFFLNKKNHCKESSFSKKSLQKI
jgi:hypothetical protein